MIIKNDILTKKTTQMTDNQSISTIFTLYNDYDGDIYTNNNLQDVLLMLSSNEIKEWFTSRDFIPKKSNFIIEKRQIDLNTNRTPYNSPTKKIIKIKASLLLNL